MNKIKLSILFYLLISPWFASATDWPNFRGGQQLPGIIKGKIPTKVELKWAFQTGSEIKSSPVMQGNSIVLGSTDGFVYCLDLQGNLLWKFETDNAIEAPALILNSTVYIGNLSGMLYALQLKTGKLLWKYETGNQIMGAPNWWTDSKKTYLVLGSYDYYLHGIDASDGKGLWKYESQNYLNATVAVENNVAVFGGCDGLLHVVDILSGKAVSTVEVATYVAGSAVLEKEKAYVGDYDGRLSCVDYTKKTVVWSYQNAERPLPFIGSPSLQGEKLIAGSRDRFIYCLNKNSGELIWKKDSGGSVDASVLADKNNVLVANMRGDLMLLDLENGSEIWSFELGSPVIGGPGVSNDIIIVGAQDGNIYCLGVP